METVIRLREAPEGFRGNVKVAATNDGEIMCQYRSGLNLMTPPETTVD